MRNRGRRTWTAWIVLWAFLLSVIGPNLALAHEQVPPFGDDICSASQAPQRPAPAAPAHSHKHCHECVIGAALQFGAPPAEVGWEAEAPARFVPLHVRRAPAPVSRVEAANPRGPPALV